MSIEYVDALKWPTVALAAVVLLLLWCGPALARFVDRLVRVQSGDHVAEAGPISADQQKPPPPRADTLPNNTADGRPKRIELRPGYAAHIYQKSSEDFDDIETRVRFLSNLCGIEFQQKLYERFYRSAFGSQLLLLDKLNESYKFKLLDVRNRYMNDRDALGLSDYEFERWIHYPSQYGLIEIAGDEVRITQDGRDFLLYAINSGYSLHRPL